MLELPVKQEASLEFTRNKQILIGLLVFIKLCSSILPGVCAQHLRAMMG